MVQRLRSDLHAILKSMVSNVYFQPPASITMIYPCIVYQRDYINIDHANNDPYKRNNRWMITTIDRDPESDIPNQIAKLRSAAFSRFFGKTP